MKYENESSPCLTVAVPALQDQINELESHLSRIDKSISRVEECLHRLRGDQPEKEKVGTNPSTGFGLIAQMRYYNQSYNRLCDQLDEKLNELEELL